MTAADHRNFMECALKLAKRGRFSTRPNPMVGALVVSPAGEVLGEGFHVRAGGPHAERHAIAAARERTRGATLYCTLEPCDHTGRTGPCTEAVIEAGFARVVVGAVDPNPQVSGRGLKRLRSAGIEVVEGVLSEACSALNQVFNHWVVHRRPFVTLKLASSLDGRIAAAPGSRTHITGALAQRRVHELRAQADAILVGAGTVLADDPRLDVRNVKPLTVLESRVDSPRPVVLDSQLRTPLDAKLCREGAVIVTALSESSVAKRSGPYRDRGVDVWSLPHSDGRVNLEGLITRLGTFDAKPVSSLLVEGGASVAAAFIDAGLVNRWLLHVGPRALGAGGVPTLDTLENQSSQWSIGEIRRLGKDLELELRPCSPD